MNQFNNYNNKKNLIACNIHTAKFILSNGLRTKFVLIDGNTATEVKVSIINDDTIICHLPYSYITDDNIKLTSIVKIALDNLGQDENHNQLLYVQEEKNIKQQKEEDITKLKPFDKVLVRDRENRVWEADLFERYDESNSDYKYLTISNCHRYCIPYEGNEYLLGTTDSPKKNNY